MARDALAQGNGADIGWMTIREASDLTGTPVVQIKRLIDEGVLQTRTIERKGKPKIRLTRAALVEAGLLGNGTNTPDAYGHLIALIREQNQRIAQLEDQRAHLAARLGATTERIQQLETKIDHLELPAVSLDPEGFVDEPATPSSITTDDGLVIESKGISPEASGRRRQLARLVRSSASTGIRGLVEGTRRRLDSDARSEGA